MPAGVRDWLRASIPTGTPLSAAGTLAMPRRMDWRVVNEEGRIDKVTMSRWGNPDRKGWRPVSFTVSVSALDAFGEIIVPSRFRAGWSDDGDPDRDFSEAEIGAARWGR